MITVLGMVLCVMLDPPAPAHKASDMELIANWVCGRDPGKAFSDPFGDRELLAGQKDTLLYTDLSGVRPPDGMKAVNYEFIQARMGQIRAGEKGPLAVLITRSSFEEPAKDRVREETRIDKAGARVYYVEVAIGNHGWHWFKVVVREEGEKTIARILWAAVS
jgi:hypothetical protein